MFCEIILVFPFVYIAAASKAVVAKQQQCSCRCRYWQRHMVGASTERGERL
jgi:hypothetical protein